MNEAPETGPQEGAECRPFRDGRVRTTSVGVLLTGTSGVAHYTEWKSLQIIPIEHVADEIHGRAGYGAGKCLKTP